MAQRPVLDYKKLALLVLFCVVVYNEFLGYLSAYNEWPKKIYSSSEVVNVLLVADPQLQGVKDEPSGFWGEITRWDSDRFLRKTFSWAYSYYDLDAIVFLGDLIDEGSKSDAVTYDEYVSRFYSIYPKPVLKSGDVNSNKRSEPTLVFTSGDNDIGGEGAEPVSKDMIERFNRFFPERKSTTIRSSKDLSLEIVTMNVFKMQMEKKMEREDIINKEKKTNNEKPEELNANMRMIISHIPLSPHSKRSKRSVPVDHR